MARGRKKGGLKINPLNDRNEIIKMIINQANSMNKKIKTFKKADIEEYEHYYTQYLGDLVDYTSSGLISKSKKQFDDTSTLMLKKTLSALHKINNNEYYGTVKKYKKEVTKSLRGVMDYTEKYLDSKGYDGKFTNSVVSSRDFLSKLYMAFNEGATRYGSDQIIEKVALSYGEETGLSPTEMNKILSNIEYSQNALNKIQQEQNEFDEWRRNRKMR